MSDEKNSIDDAERSDGTAHDADQEVLAAAEAELAAASAAIERPKRRTSQAPVKKAAPTPKRQQKRDDHEQDGRVGPVTFTKQSVGELKKVNWPTADQLRQYFVAVLLFVLFIIAFVGLLDLGFGAILLKLFG